MSAHAPLTIAELQAALALPPMSAPARRLPKALLADHGAANQADRKLIERAVERIDWLATLNPATTGIPAGEDPRSPVAAIQLLAFTARAEAPLRLLPMVHRAIPVPVILLAGFPGETGPRLSLAPLRRAERIAEQMVVIRQIVTPPLAGGAGTAEAAFLASLPLQGLPRGDLGAVYDGLVWRIEALEAALKGGHPFRLPATPEEAGQRQAQLAELARAEAEWNAARAAARAEKRLARQVELANEAQRLKAHVAQLAQGLE